LQSLGFFFALALFGSGAILGGFAIVTANETLLQHTVFFIGHLGSPTVVVL
jgi:hypothetical protein